MPTTERREMTFEEALTSLFDAINEADDEDDPVGGPKLWRAVRAAHARALRKAAAESSDERVVAHLILDVLAKQEGGDPLVQAARFFVRGDYHVASQWAQSYEQRAREAREGKRG